MADDLSKRNDEAVLGEDVVLKERELQSELLAQLPLKAQLGFSSLKDKWSNSSDGKIRTIFSAAKTNEPLKVEYTCIDVGTQFIVLGSNLGVVYFFERCSRKLSKFMCDHKQVPISSMKLLESKLFVATGQYNGAVTLFNFSDGRNGLKNVDLKCTVESHHKVPVTCIQWTPDGTKLFTADSEGNVAITVINMHEKKTHTVFICRENSPVVQLSFSHTALLISTLKRTLIWPFNTKTTVQVGMQERKVFGNFGACFYPEAGPVPSDEQGEVYAARPGLRLWRATMEGKVLSTMIFKDSINKGIPAIETKDLPHTLTQQESRHGEQKQFGPLVVFHEQFLVTWQGSCLWVMDAMKGVVVGCHSNLGYVVDVGFHKNELFVLTKGREKFIRRIEFEVNPCIVVEDLDLNNPNDVRRAVNQFEDQVKLDKLIDEVGSKMNSAMSHALTNVKSRVINLREQYISRETSEDDRGSESDRYSSPKASYQQYKKGQCSPDCGAVTSEGYSTGEEKSEKYTTDENNYSDRPFESSNELQNSFEKSPKIKASSGSSGRGSGTAGNIDFTNENEEQAQLESEEKTLEFTLTHKKRETEPAFSHLSKEEFPKDIVFESMSVGKGNRRKKRKKKMDGDKNTTPPLVIPTTKANNSDNFNSIETNEEDNVTTNGTNENNKLTRNNGDADTLRNLITESACNDTNSSTKTEDETLKFQASEDIEQTLRSDPENDKLYFESNESTPTSTLPINKIIENGSLPRDKSSHNDNSVLDNVSTRGSASISSTVKPSHEKYNNGDITPIEGNFDYDRTVNNDVRPIESEEYTPATSNLTDENDTIICSEENTNISKPDARVSTNTKNVTTSKSTIDIEIENQEDSFTISNEEKNAVYSVQKYNEKPSADMNLRKSSENGDKQSIDKNVLNEQIEHQELKRHPQHAELKQQIKENSEKLNKGDSEEIPSTEDLVNLQQKGNLHENDNILSESNENEKEHNTDINSRGMGKYNEIHAKIDSPETSNQTRNKQKHSTPHTTTAMRGTIQQSKQQDVSKTDMNVVNVKISHQRQGSNVSIASLSERCKEIRGEALEHNVKSKALSENTAVDDCDDSLEANMFRNDEDIGVVRHNSSDLSDDDELYPMGAFHKSETNPSYHIYSEQPANLSDYSFSQEDFISENDEKLIDEMMDYDRIDVQNDLIESIESITDVEDNDDEETGAKGIPIVRKKRMIKTRNSFPSSPSGSDLEGRPLSSPKGAAAESIQERLRYLADSWADVNTPNNCGQIQLIASSTQLVWLIDNTDQTYYSPTMMSQAYTWKKLENSGKVSLIATNPNGSVVWCVERNGLAQYRIGIKEGSPQGTSWEPFEKNVHHVAVDKDSVWVIKKNGDVFVRTSVSSQRPYGTSWITIKASSDLVQITCMDGIVWALDIYNHVQVFQGDLRTISVTDPAERDLSWEEIPGITASHINLGSKAVGWLIDRDNGIWFNEDISRETPAGGHWYQLSLGEAQSQEPMWFSSVLSYFTRGNEPTMIVANEVAGVMILGRQGSIHVAHGHLLGARWQLSLPSQVKEGSCWTCVSAAGADMNKGYVWALQPNGQLFCFKSGRQSYNVHPPNRVVLKYVSAGPRSLWALTAGQDVYLRLGISDTCPQGLKWLKVDMLAQGNKRLTSICAGNHVVWAVDFQGDAWFQMGREDKRGTGYAPAWVSVDGCPLDGSRFTKIAVGPDDSIVWACDNKNNVYARKDITVNFWIGTSWELVSGSSAKDLAVSSNHVWCLCPNGDVLCRFGVSKNNVSGDYWKKVPGNLDCFSVGANDELWGINRQGHLYERNTLLFYGSTLSCRAPSYNDLFSDHNDWEFI